MAVKELGRRSVIAGAVGSLAYPARAQRTEAGPDVSIALVLAADISTSVTQERFELQRQGYARAFADARVIRAIQHSLRGCIGLCYFEWAGRHSQRVLVPWTLMRTLEDGERIAAILDSAPRPFNGSTGLGPAIAFAADLLARSPFSPADRIIDVSGDGLHNDGDEGPAAARDRAVAAGLRVNGLPIASGYQAFPGHLTLAEYYEDHVIGGADAFIVEAGSFEMFGSALISKLRRELADPAATEARNARPA